MGTVLHKKFVVICSVCWRARYDNPAADQDRNNWQDLDALLTDEHLDGEDYALSHDYCPTCLEAFLQEFHARQITACQRLGSFQRQAIH